MSSASMNDRVCEHALRVAREKGWYVHPADCAVTPAPTAEFRLSGHAVYWDVRLIVRAALNTHRVLTRDGLISGMVRLSGNSLLDTLTESPEALQARLHANGES